MGREACLTTKVHFGGQEGTDTGRQKFTKRIKQNKASDTQMEKLQGRYVHSDLLLTL